MEPGGKQSRGGAAAGDVAHVLGRQTFQVDRVERGNEDQRQWLGSDERMWTMWKVGDE